MSTAPRPRLRHVVTRKRITVDVDRWLEFTGGTEDGLDEAVRKWDVRLVGDSEAARAGAIASVRRDRR